MSSNVIKGVAITTLINYSGISRAAVKSQATVVLFYVITNGVRQEVYDIEIKQFSNCHERPAYVKAMHAYVLLCFGYRMTLKNPDTFHSAYEKVT